MSMNIKRSKLPPVYKRNGKKCYLDPIRKRLIYITPEETVEGYDNMTKVRDYYTGKVFFHQVYYKLERHYLDSQVMEALEDDAARFSESVDDIIQFVEAVAGDNIEALLQAKQKYIKRLSDFTSAEQQEKIDELTQQVVEKIIVTIQKLDDYDTLYRTVSQEFLPYATVLLQHPHILSSLVSAEYLYQQYVEKKDPNNKFDYSCISIMYYMSLEDFINKLVYTPYVDEVLSRLGFRKPSDDREKWKKWKNGGYKEYVSSAIAFWNKNNHAFKRSCEIGNLGFLLEGIRSETKFETFLLAKYPKADMNKVQGYGTKLRSVAPRRNEAAHGGNYLSYTDALTDKENVYNISVTTFRGLIMELLDMLF